MDWWGLKEALLDIIYPVGLRCLLCSNREENLRSGWLCHSCLDSLPFVVPPACPKCGKPVLVEGDICPDCLHAYHPYYQAMSILEYRRGVPELIHRYKYLGERVLAKPMIEWMTLGVKKKGWHFDIIVPVPLHQKKQRMRGFNQATLLAQGIGRNLSKPLICNNLIRVHDTPAQAVLDKQERMANLQEAFRAVEPEAFKGKTVLLVDDVYTTGATVDQCSRILLGAGANRVYVLTLATGRNI